MAQQQWSAPPAMQIDVAKEYAVSIETSRGTIELTLYPQHAPQTVNNFVFLAGQGFYDGVKFHRVIADFMVQTGDPTGTGRGGPGYRFGDECKNNPLKHERGVISMANAGPDTNGSQFFIMHMDYDLPPNYVIFARVTDGMPIVDRLADTPTTLGADGGMSQPVTPPIITKVVIAP